MNVYGVGSAGIRVPFPQEAPRRLDAERPAAKEVAAPPGSRNAFGSGVSPVGATLPVEAPTGTDPELWSVLDTNERVFFAGGSGIGPLTYSHMTTSGQPNVTAQRGGRIDLRA